MREGVNETELGDSVQGSNVLFATMCLNVYMHGFSSIQALSTIKKVFYPAEVPDLVYPVSFLHLLDAIEAEVCCQLADFGGMCQYRRPCLNSQ